MTFTRRGLLLGFGAALAAPAVVRAESLMKLWVPPAPKLITSLDDYEEGTWTPVVSFGGSSVRHFPNAGLYTKIGNMVNFTADISFPWTAEGYIVTGVPFVAPVDLCAVVTYGDAHRTILSGVKQVRL